MFGLSVKSHGIVINTVILLGSKTFYTHNRLSKYLPDRVRLKMLPHTAYCCRSSAKAAPRYGNGIFRDMVSNSVLLRRRWRLILKVGKYESSK